MIAGDERAWELLMDKLGNIDAKLDAVIAVTNKHEVSLEQAKLVGRIAHYIGWPSLLAGVHHLWQQMK